MSKLSLNQAKTAIVDKLGSDYSISFEKERPNAYLFVCRSNEKNRIPSGLIVAVNKTTGQFGISITSSEQAFQKCEEIQNG